MQISKWIIAFVALYGGIGGIMFDAVIPATSRQHLWNPAWPPHAKFHNGQTMLMGFFNAIAVLVLLFVLRPLTLPVFLASRLARGVLLRLHVDRAASSRHRLERSGVRKQSIQDRLAFRCRCF